MGRAYRSSQMEDEAWNIVALNGPWHLFNTTLSFSGLFFVVPALTFIS